MSELLDRPLTSGLDVETVAESLELWELGQFGDLDVHGGAEGGSQVGGAERQVAQALALGEGKAAALHLPDALHK